MLLHNGTRRPWAETYRGEAFLTAGQLALPRGLVLGTASLKLVSNRLLTDLLSLQVVDRLHQHTLVLVHITLYLQANPQGFNACLQLCTQLITCGSSH